MKNLETKKNKNGRPWIRWLVAFTFVSFLINILIFYPGYMSPDSTWQLCQALGECKLNDWHPISMSLAWRLLINITGSVASMLIFQIAILWVALGLLAYFVWYKKRNKLFSLLPLAIGFLPNIINTSGVIWKDNQMAFVLLLITSLILVMTTISPKAKTIRAAVLSVTLLLLVYAVSVRTNAFIAVAPLAFVAVGASSLFERTQRYSLFAALLVITIGLALPRLLSGVYEVENGNFIGSVMAPDIVNILEPKEIAGLEVSESLKEGLALLSECSHFDGALELRFWVCVDMRKHFTDDKSYGELSTLWRKTVMEHPLRYVAFKAEAYSMFLFPDEKQLIWQGGIDGRSNFDKRFPLASVALGGVNHTYTKNFGYKYFPFLYAAWFWLSISMLLMVYARRLTGQSKGMVYILACSGALYILSFVPASVTPDHRYIYWPILACLAASCILLAERKKRLPKT